MRQKPGEAIDRMTANAREDIVEPGEGIDLGPLTGSHKAAQHCGGSATNIATKEHPVDATHGNAANAALGR